MKTATARRTVTLDRYLTCLSVRPAVPELAALTVVSHQAEVMPNAEFRIVRVIEGLYGYDESWNLMEFHAGIEPVVLQVLRKAGYEIRWDRNVAALPEPDWQALGSVLPVDSNFLRCVRDYERALTVTGTDLINPARFVAQIALAYPTARVAALVPRNESGHELAHTLRSYLPRAQFAHDGGPDLRDERVVVANYSYAGFFWTDYHRWDIVLCFEALSALGRFPHHLFTRVKAIRIYGLQPSGLCLAPRDRDDLHQMFGFRQISIPRHGCQGLPVDVAFAPIKGGPAVNNGSVLDVKRSGIWQNQLRNRRVIQLALAFARGNQTKVSELCPAAAGLKFAPEGTKVVVLIENEEHRDVMARELQRQGKQSFLHRYPSGGNRLWLVTFSESWKVDWTEVDVLVRADGGEYLPPIPDPQLLAIPCDSDHRLLVVDFDDRNRLRMRTRARQDAYRKSGWLPPGVDALEASIDRFLAERVRVKP